MANQRAQLVTHELEALHRPLPTPAVHRSPVAPAEAGGFPPLGSAVDFMYPELVGKKKDRMVSTSFRLPMSQVDALEELKTTKGVIPSELVRRLIADFLASQG